MHLTSSSYGWLLLRRDFTLIPNMTVSGGGEFGSFFVV
jgi:hypothetical protein